MNTTVKHMYVRKASAGTGKTFTLAAHYIALLLHGEHYRSILAVTFTNKATAEMKDRIIAYLYAIAHYTNDGSTQGFLNRVREIYSELGYNKNQLTDDYCKAKAQTIHADLLVHYDEMRVQTIDSFLQGLLAGMVIQLDGTTVGYSVELDTKRVISDAVDDLITNTEQDSAVLKRITMYMDERMNDEKNWDIRNGLCEIGEELYKEFIQNNEEHLTLDEGSLTDFKKKIDWHTHVPMAEFQQALNQAGRWMPQDFTYGQRDVVNKINKLQEEIKGNIEEDSKAFEGFNNTLLKGMGILVDENGTETIVLDIKAYKGTENPLAIQEEILKLHHYAQTFRTAYIRDKWRTKFINDLLLMGALEERIKRHLQETNTCLLCTTANTLRKALKDGDADFILEKAGIRYKHIMLDEFQDTSSLQWENFKKLLQEILSSIEGSTLIVGDIKQSIYRWRNGNWEIMKGLATDWPNNYAEPASKLIRNFRSHEEIVHFNIETMYHLTNQNEGDEIKEIYDEGYHPDGSNLTDYYNPKNTGGFVQVRCYTQTADRKETEKRHQVRQNILQDMLQEINRLLEEGVLAKDIMILIRAKKEANEILDAINALPEGSCEMLQKTSIQSPECFQLQFSPMVNLLISALRYIYTDDTSAKEYVTLFAPTFDISTRRTQLRTMALTDLVELLIKECIPTMPAGEDGKSRSDKDVNDLSYLNCFRDKILHYVQSSGSDGLTFLRYWDDKMCTESVPTVNTDGIRLMTIHSSKGLEAANVFIPFCDWEMEEDKRGCKLWCSVKELQKDNRPTLLPIPQNKTMAEAGFADEYAQEHHLQRIDNLNLLYVAITRAAERLFIYADVTNIKDSKGKNIIKERNTWDVGQLMAERCGMWEQLDNMFQEKRIGAENDFEEFTYGERQWKAPAKEEKEDKDPLSFEKAATLDSACYSDDAQIVFCQSQDSRKYGWDIQDLTTLTTDLEQSAFGTICHNLLATLTVYSSKEDAQKALTQHMDRAYKDGVIPTQKQYEQMQDLLRDTIDGLSQWFTGEWDVQCEKSVLFRDATTGEIREYRMDRVMWSRDKKQAVVIDYKFGQDNPHYDRQVRNYMDICQRMGAESVCGYLWIAQTKHLKEITL